MPNPGKFGDIGNEAKSMNNFFYNCMYRIN